MTRLMVTLLLVSGSTGEPSLRKSEDKSSSLFQRFMTVPVDVPVAPPYPAYSPYMYDPNAYYYGYGPPGMMAPPPPQMPPPQYYVENNPPMYYGYPAVPPQGPAPPVAQQPVMYASPPQQSRVIPPRPKQQVVEQAPPTVAPTVVQLEPPVVESPVQVHESNPEPNELKDKLSKALAEASKQMDRVSNNALAPNAFDDLIWKPSSKPIETMSLSEDSVPIDNHILNWRDLVGLPADK